ncbi:hypothetical protein KVV02_004805, partial [Mortierella alpina]
AYKNASLDFVHSSIHRCLQYLLSATEPQLSSQRHTPSLFYAMLGLLSAPSGTEAVQALKAALPIGLGLASAAFLTIKAATRDTQNVDKSIPTASYRPGETSHDVEYNENADLFMIRCQEQYGPVFNIHRRNRWSTVVSDPLVREIFMTEDLSFAINELTGIHAFTASVIKTKRGFNHPTIHEIIRDIVTPNLAL